MAKPKTKGKRPGGRNFQFFEGLSGLKRGLDAAIARTLPTLPPMPINPAEKRADADAKRKAKLARRAARNRGAT